MSQEIHLTGIPICPGIAIGRPFFLSNQEETVPEFPVAENELVQEIKRYRGALEQSKVDVLALKKALQKEEINEGASILDAHLQIMDDPVMNSRIEDEILRSRKNAEYVFQQVIREFQVRFNMISDPFFKERFKDLQDISQRVMGYLCAKIRVSLKETPPESIVFAHEIIASDAAEADCSHVKAFVTHQGGGTSHAAIVAKAKGIPYVTSVDLTSIELFKNHSVIVDGKLGKIIINPNPETLKKYQIDRINEETRMKAFSFSGQYPTETIDGCPIQLVANIDSLYDLDLLHIYGSKGVGLLRTECLFLNRQDFPTEEEQYTVYKSIVEKMQGLPIVIRTFDVGGDKVLPKKRILSEENPFLGCRAIRFLLREKQIFKDQIRAILRVSQRGNVRIMFPMISALCELREAKCLVQDVQKELGLKELPLIGCMIEVPSAAIITDLLAQECDFFSIGTNDLVQYSLAVDRGNQKLRDLYTPAHPSVLRLIKLIIHEANKKNIPVSICGEVAADPKFIPLLLGIGVKEFSVAIRYLPIVKNKIRQVSMKQAKYLAEKAFTLSTPDEIEKLLHDFASTSIRHAKI